MIIQKPNMRNRNQQNFPLDIDVFLVKKDTEFVFLFLNRQNQLKKHTICYGNWHLAFDTCFL